MHANPSPTAAFRTAASPSLPPPLPSDPLLAMSDQQQRHHQKQQGAVRLGVKMHPPTVLVEYRHVVNVPPPPPQQPRKGLSSISINNATSNLRRKSIRLHNLASSKDSAQDVASALSHNFPKHFGHGIVNYSQLVTLIAKLQGSLVTSSKPQGPLSSSKVQGSLARSSEVKDDKDDGVDHLAQGRTQTSFDKDDSVDHLAQGRTQRSIDESIDKIDKKSVADEVIARETITQPPEQQKYQGGGIVSDREKQQQGGDVIVSDGNQQHQGGDAVSDRKQQQQQEGDVIASDDVGGNPLPVVGIATVLGVVGEQQSEGSEDSAAEIKSSIESTIGNQSIGDHTDQSEKCGHELMDSLIRATEGIGHQDQSEKCEEMIDSLIRATEEGGDADADDDDDVGDDGDDDDGDNDDDDYDFGPLQPKAAIVPPQANPADVSDGEDLNKISEAELVAAKGRMDVMFQQNQLLPGEQGYAHDVRREFGEAEEDCGWDDED